MRTRTPATLSPFDPRESGWADLIRSEMDSWFPTDLPLRFQHAGPARLGGLRRRLPLAVAGGVLAMAAAAALIGRRGRRQRSRGSAI